MFRYLKAAFWASPQVPGLGRVPVNALLVIAFLILGFGHPAFWLAGLGLEAAWLFALSHNERFRRLVDAEDIHVEEDAAEQQRQALIAKLDRAGRERFDRVEEKFTRIMQLHRDVQIEDFVLEGNRDALKKLGWLYLKLLIAWQNLATLDSDTTERDIRGQIEGLCKSLHDEKLSSSLRESKHATLRILEQRLASLERRDETLDEIASDLTRIEAQVDLALDQAGMRGKSETISMNIDLVSRLLDDSVYGESGASIAQLDRTYGRQEPPPPQHSQTQ